MKGHDLGEICGTNCLLGRDTTQLLQAVGTRELAWLQEYGRPCFPQNPLHRELHEQKKSDPAIQIKALKDFLQVSPCIVPDKQGLNRPTLRHPDLSPSNIFVSKEGEISGLIDWEDTTILPLFLQARFPEHFQNFGDEDAENFRQPRLPENFDSLSGEEKKAEEEVYRRRQLHFFYLGATSQNNRRHFDALFFDPVARRAKLYQRARSPWEGDNVSLKAELIKTVRSWPSVRSNEGMKCPIEYSEDEIKECLALKAEQKKLDETLQVWRDCIGVTADGWVSNDDYEATKQRAHDLKAEFMAGAESEADRSGYEKIWPFQDHEEVE